MSCQGAASLPGRIEVTSRIVLIRFSPAVSQGRKPTGLEHLHYHRRARARQARDNGDYLIVLLHIFVEIPDCRASTAFFFLNG